MFKVDDLLNDPKRIILIIVIMKRPSVRKARSVVFI